MSIITLNATSTQYKATIKKGALFHSVLSTAVCYKKNNTLLWKFGLHQLLVFLSITLKGMVTAPSAPLPGSECVSVSAKSFFPVGGHPGCSHSLQRMWNAAQYLIWSVCFSKRCPGNRTLSAVIKKKSNNPHAVRYYTPQEVNTIIRITRHLSLPWGSNNKDALSFQTQTQGTISNRSGTLLQEPLTKKHFRDSAL